MYSFRRLALVLAVSLAGLHVSQAQVSTEQSSSSSLIASAAQEPAQPQASTPGQQQGQLTVQARIRARREQRRAQAIHDAYSHLYETYVGMGYMRFQPGANLQKVTDYAWNTGLTRYYGERLGATVDFRGYYGTPFVGLNFSGITRPAISTYTFMGGPTYRFYLQPRYSISGRVLGGYAMGNFSADTNGFGSQALGMWKDGGTYAVDGAVLGEYNLTPNVALRLSGDYLGTGFGSTMQNNVGFTGGFVVRFGKQ